MRKYFLFFTACVGMVMLGGCGKEMGYNPYDRDWQEPVILTFAPITSSDDRAKADTTHIVLTGEDLVGVSRITIGDLPISITTVNLKTLTALVTGQYYPNESPNPDNPMLSLFDETVIVYSWKDPEIPLYLLTDFKIEWWHKYPIVTGVYIDADDAGTDPKVKLPDATEQLAGAQITILGEHLETVREVRFGDHVTAEVDRSGEVSSTEIVVTIPDHPSWQPGINAVDISLNYGYPPTLVYTADNYEADNTPAGGTLPDGFTGMRDFKVVIPVVTGTTHTQAGLNEIVELTGEGLNYINRITVEGVDLPIVEEARAADGTMLSFQITYGESGYPFDSGSLVDIIGYYHDPVRTVTLLEDFEFFTDIADVEPFMEGYTSTHKTADGSVYVNGPAVITGTQLNGVTAITIGGERATMAAYGNTPVKLSFNLPRTLKFEGQQDLPVVVTWGPDHRTKELGTIRVNPIYLATNLQMGIANVDVNSTNWYMQVLVFDSLRVLSTDEFMGLLTYAGRPPIDQPSIIRTPPEEAVTTAHSSPDLALYGTSLSTSLTNAINKTGRYADGYKNTPLSRSEYYSVPPYMYMQYVSNYSALQNPITGYLGASKLILSDGTQAYGKFGAVYNSGTPMVSIRALYKANNQEEVSTRTDDTSLRLQIQSGAITDLNDITLRLNAGRVGLAYAVPDEIYLVGYVRYEFDGGTSPLITDMLRIGYIKLTETSFTANIGHNNLSWIKFDLYWPINDRSGVSREEQP